MKILVEDFIYSYKDVIEVRNCWLKSFGSFGGINNIRPIIDPLQSICSLQNNLDKLNYALKLHLIVTN